MIYHAGQNQRIADIEHRDLCCPFQRVRFLVGRRECHQAGNVEGRCEHECQRFSRWDDRRHCSKEELPDWVNADWQTSLFKNLINYDHVKLDIKIRKCDNKTIREKQHTILKDIVNMKQYIVDAFTDRPFSGNPAAVCVMDSWPSEEAMMKLAMENNLSETAFIVKEEAGYHLRWFTPGTEVELCGHATLASSYVILTFCEPESPERCSDGTEKGKSLRNGFPDLPAERDSCDR